MVSWGRSERGKQPSPSQPRLPAGKAFQLLWLVNSLFSASHFWTSNYMYVAPNICGLDILHLKKHTLYIISERVKFVGQTTPRPPKSSLTAKGALGWVRYAGDYSKKENWELSTESINLQLLFTSWQTWTVLHCQVELGQNSHNFEIQASKHWVSFS